MPAPDDPASTFSPSGTSALGALTGSHAALPVGTRMAEFEISRVIGEGGFGIVYLAYDHTLARQVAIKEYMPNQLAARTRELSVSVRSERHTETFAAGLRSFVNEARLLAQFDHPSLLKVYRFWEAHGTAYMVMPFVEGVTLKVALSTMGASPDEVWLRALIGHLLDALEQMHEANCFHRDIAPDNILLLPDGRPLLLDFGAARRVIGDMTKGPTVILKPGYAPVEQYGELPNMRQGPWTDLYALASVAHYAIVGTTPPQAVGRYLADKYEPLTQVAAGRYSVPFLQALDMALRVDPQDRPQSVAQMRALLQGERVDLPTPARRPMHWPAPGAAPAADVARASVPVSASVSVTAPASAGALPAARAAAGPHGAGRAANPTRTALPERAAWVVPALVGVSLLAGVAALWYSIHGATTLRFDDQSVERPRIGLPAEPASGLASPATGPVVVPTPTARTPSGSASGVIANPGAAEPTPAALPLPPAPCGRLIQRLSLGEKLNNEEKAYLDRECR